MSKLEEELLDGFYANPLDAREAIFIEGGEPIGGVTLHHMKEEYWGPNYIHLEEVRAFVRGGGRTVMEILIERADDLCLKLAGTVKPLPSPVYGMKKMNAGKLMAWYKQFGFVLENPKHPSSRAVIRYPDPKNCPQEEGSRGVALKR